MLILNSFATPLDKHLVTQDAHFCVHEKWFEEKSYYYLQSNHKNLIIPFKGLHKGMATKKDLISINV